MPKTPIDYSKSVIYKLCCKDPEIKDIYIGSTTNFRNRKNQHKSKCNKEKCNRRVYNCIRDNGNWENWDMVMIEEYKDCMSKLQLEKKERYYIETLCATLNICIPTRTNKEYLVSSRDKRLEKMTIYRNENKEKIKILKQKHYQKNKEKIKKKNREKNNCSCGGSYSYSDKSRHLKTKKHIKYLENNTE